MKTLQCPVCGSELERIQRSFLMRLLPWSVRYRCSRCSRQFFNIGSGYLVRLSQF